MRFLYKTGFAETSSKIVCLSFARPTIAYYSRQEEHKQDKLKFDEDEMKKSFSKSNKEF